MMEERILFIKLDPKTEADVICWMNSLPHRTVNRTVNEIAVAESRGLIARIPNEFSFTNQVEPLRCRLIFRSRAALNLLTKIPKGEYKSTLVAIIRRHIEKSKGMPHTEYKIHKRYLCAVTNQFVNMINAKKQETKGVPNRYDKLSKFFELAFTNFYNAVFEYYKHLLCFYKINYHTFFSLSHVGSYPIRAGAIALRYWDIFLQPLFSLSQNHC